MVILIARDQKLFCLADESLIVSLLVRTLNLGFATVNLTLSLNVCSCVHVTYIGGTRGSLMSN